MFQSGRKETVLDLAKFVDKGVQVKLTGGRQGPLSLLHSHDLCLFGQPVFRLRDLGPF